MTAYLSYKYIPLIGTGIFALVAAILFVYVLTVKLKEKRLDREFDKQVKFSMNPERVQEGEKESFITRKLNVLPQLLIKAGMIDKEVKPEDIKRKMLLYGAAGFTIGTILMKNPIGGLIIPMFLYLIIRVLAMFKISKKKNIVNEQIPAFVSVFKANIQANQHAQNAMVNAIESTSHPLYEELARAKAIMEAGDFRPGIISLRMNTENETLRQMASCIELASSSGSNIEEQIEVIEEIIRDKQIIERKKKLGINENKPLFYVAAAFVPIAFFGSYFMSEMHRNYWFSTPVSYAIIVGVIVAMIISSWLTWKVIQKVDIG